MAAIDQVIARARQADGGFSERKHFKLARRRAIEKLRRFALADPYFYILEIIQAAVAGGADYVDISCGDGDIIVSWTGGWLREHELAALFDFLFASKERLDLAHVRSLALGVNALMLYEPEQVVIESGDGTEGNTSRMVVRAGAESVDVGRADKPLDGTYVRATKLDREKVAASTGRKGDEGGGLEYATVELRCLAAPVPVVFNGQPMFGWARQRVPNLFGYAKVASFDEGDLYGTIGLKPSGGEPGFQLLTHGVWIQSYTYDLVPGHRLGGVICFDRLHKTVDHSGFVRDDRFEELWVRLRPYADALISGRASPVASITSAEGLTFSPAELRELLREHPRVVVVAIDTEQEEDEDDGNLYNDQKDDAKRMAVNKRAKQIARLLDAEILRVPAAQVSAVRVLGGRELLLWRPRLSDMADLRIYAQAPLPAPAGPHLIAPAELPAPTLDALLGQIVDLDALQAGQGVTAWTAKLDELDGAGNLVHEAREGELPVRVRAQLRAMIGETGSIHAMLYAPVDPGVAAGGLLVRVTSTGRLLRQALFMSAYPGRILDVELPSAQVSALERHGFARRIAERFAALAIPLLREQDDRTLAGLGVGKIEPDTPAARLALQVLSRVTLTRLRAARPGRLSAGLSFSLLRPSAGFDPYALPLLRTVSGKPISLRELALVCDETGGLVYATIPEVPADLDGLDLDRVLALDELSERTLIGLLGESGYVRVDARDVLCERRGVRVRDIAIGLRSYPEFPLLVEGAVELLDTLDDAGRLALLDELLAGLIDRMHGRADEPGGDPGALEEHRRQAVRHLQWYACRALAAGQSVRGGVLELPLFLDIDGQVWSLAQVHAGLAAGLLVHYGHVLGSAELGALTEAARSGAALGEGLPTSLACSAYCYRLLAPLGRLRLAFDFDLDDVEAASNPMTATQAFLVRADFVSPWANGVLGVPATRLSEYRIQLRARGRGSIAALDELAYRYGMVGSIEIDDAAWDEQAPEALLAALDQHATTMIESLITKLAALGDDARRFEAALAVLLTYLGESLTLIASPIGLAAELGTALAERVASLPLFDTGAATLASAHRMIELFRAHFEHRHTVGEHIPPLDWSTMLAANTPAVTRAWLDAHLQPARVVMPASAGAHASAPERTAAGELRAWPSGHELTFDALAWNLEHWLDLLRPDPREDTRPRPPAKPDPEAPPPEPRRLRATRVWIADHMVSERADALVEGSDWRLDLYGAHPLIEQLLTTPSPLHLAWVLLAIYAYLNTNSGLIGNAHELEFQARITDALLSGKLVVLEPGADALFEQR